jgi:hypothetical protein
VTLEECQTVVNNFILRIKESLNFWKKLLWNFRYVICFFDFNYTITPLT